MIKRIPEFILYLYRGLYAFIRVGAVKYGTRTSLSFEIHRTSMESDSDDDVTFGDILEKFESSWVLEFLISLGSTDLLMPDTIKYQLIVEDDDNAYIQIQCETCAGVFGVPFPDEEYETTYATMTTVVNLGRGVRAIMNKTPTHYKTSPLYTSFIDLAAAHSTIKQPYLFCSRILDYVAMYDYIMEPAIFEMISVATHNTSWNKGNNNYDLVAFRNTRKITDPFIKFHAIFDTAYVDTHLTTRILIYPKEVLGYNVSWFDSDGMGRMLIDIRKSDDYLEKGPIISPTDIMTVIGTAWSSAIPLTISADPKFIVYNGRTHCVYYTNAISKVKSREVTNFILIPDAYDTRTEYPCIEFTDAIGAEWQLKHTQNGITKVANLKFEVFVNNNAYAAIPDTDDIYSHAIGIVTESFDSPVEYGVITPGLICDSGARSFLSKNVVDMICRMYLIDKSKLSICLKPLSYYPTEIRYLLEVNLESSKIPANSSNTAGIINNDMPENAPNKQLSNTKKGLRNFFNLKK